MKERVNLTKDFEISRIAHGHWRLNEWGLSNKDLLKFVNQIIELGITTFEHADIYGDYNGERMFGNALKLDPALRKKIELVTKCGINLLSDKFPERKIKHYNFGYNHIVSSVENSLKNFNTDYVDMLLLHRPAPFFNPGEVARAFQDLKKEGKVRYFGVSNYTKEQFEMLSTYVEEPLVTNQVEISPYCLEHFKNGNIDFFLKEKIKPMAWSPLSGGNILNPRNKKGIRLLKTLEEVGAEMEVPFLDMVVYCWLLKHPVQMIPIIGTGKLDRIKNAVHALSLEMTIEQWYKIYTASTGVEVP